MPITGKGYIAKKIKVTKCQGPTLSGFKTWHFENGVGVFYTPKLSKG